MDTPIDPGPLVLEDVGKSFEKLTVLHDIDLTVPSGATVALLGPSGCGKTTLLRCIAGLERPDIGIIRLGERVLTGPQGMVPPERRRIGMVFQDWALFPHLDVASNIGYGLTEGREATQVGVALEMVGLEGLGGRMPTTLSGGQQQRVAIARALAPNPDVLLLDEPFSNLDAALRIKVRSETRKLLADVGTTALFVTHDQGEAFVMGDEVAVMGYGSIRQQADPTTLYDDPSDPWVARFVGEANLIPATGVNGVAETVVGSIPVKSEATGACTLLVRPEQLHLEPGDQGTVVDVEFYGHDISYVVELADSTVLVRAMTGPRFRTGDRVSVRFDGPPVVVYPTEGLIAAS